MFNPQAWWLRCVCWLGMMGSITVALWLPPFAAPDEAVHWYRAVHVSSGHVFSTRHDGWLGEQLPLWAPELYEAVVPDMMPPSGRIKTSIWQRAQSVKYTNEKKFVVFNATAMYPPTFYLPQATAIRVCRWLHVQPLTIFYCARLFNAVVNWLLLTFILHWAGELAFFCGSLLLLPVVLQQLGSLSPDAGMITATLGLVALFRRTVTAPTKDPVLWPCITVIIGLLAQARPPLLALGALLYTPALARHAGQGVRRARLRASAVVSLIGVPWFLGSLAVGGPLRTDLPPVSARVADLIHAPGSFLFQLWRTTWFTADGYLWMLTGSLGWLDAQISRSAYDAAKIGLVCGLLASMSRPYKTGRWTSSAVAVAILGSYIGMQVIFFLTWTPPTSTTILGFQGRYMMMFLPFLPLALPRIALPRWSIITLNILSFSSATRALASVPWTLLGRYYFAA